MSRRGSLNLSMDRIQIRQIDFLQAKPLWERLWPNRRSALRATSSMLYLGGFDVSLHDSSPAYFFGAFHGEQLIGVVSGHATGKSHFRSRGLFVESAYQRQGVARRLMQALKAHASQLGFELLWTSPRQSAWAFYEAFGFERCSGWIEENFEFGPNCYAKMDLNTGFDVDI